MHEGVGLSLCLSERRVNFQDYRDQFVFAGYVSCPYIFTFHPPSLIAIDSFRQLSCHSLQLRRLAPSRTLPMKPSEPSLASILVCLRKPLFNASITRALFGACIYDVFRCPDLMLFWGSFLY